MSLDSDDTIGIGPLGDGFAVWICTEGSWCPHAFPSHPEARAFAAGTYAQGGFTVLKDFAENPSLLQPESDEVRHLKGQVAFLMDALASAPSSMRLH